MPDRARGSWLRGLVGRGSGAAPPHASSAGAREVHSGIGAVVCAEGLLGSAVCHALDPRDLAELQASFVRRDDAASALATAYGMALAGRRVAVLAAATGCGDIVERLGAAVERHVPLVLYAIVREGRDIESLCATGAPVAVARDAAHAVDLSLVARRVAEAALVPVVVALEAADVAGSLAAIQAPSAELAREYIGDANDRIACPTPAQRLLFGETRRRVPRWFDLEHPTAHGQSLPGEDRAAAGLGRRVFFESAAAAVLAEAVEAFRVLTGRDLAAVSVSGPSDARRVIVARGAAQDLARSVAERLSAPIGVVGVIWQGSLAEGAIAAAFERAELVTVVDRDPARHSGWSARVRSVLARGDRRFITATHDELTAAGILAACRNLLAGSRARDEIHLGVSAPSSRTGFPRRQAVLDRVRRDFPELETLAAPESGEETGKPGEIRTVALYLAAVGSPLAAARRLDAALAGTFGPHVRGRTRAVERGLWEVRLTFGRVPFADPGADAPVDVLLVADLAHTIPADPLARMARGGTVVVATGLEPPALAAALPGTWRDAIAGLGLELRRTDRPGGTEAQVETLVRAAIGPASGDDASSERVPADALAATGADAAASRLPLAVRRFGAAGESFDNVARFFSELAQPRMFEPGSGAVPDPYVAAGAVPACASSLRDATPGRETVPRIDAERCTGCGACWVSCPDSAIGALAIGSAALLDALSGAEQASEDAAADAAAGKLRRAHRQVGSRIDTLLARPTAGSLDGAVAREAFDWVVEKMESGEPERAQLRRAAGATLERLEHLTLAVTEPFFRAPHAEQKGSGELLLLAVNPYSCQGCGICAKACTAQAIARVPQTAEAVGRMARAWRTWEDLPDTAGATIGRVSRRADVGPLAAILLSRHCALSVTGGGAEPGSGERLAVRLAAAVVEYQMQRRTLGEAGELSDLSTRLRSAIRESLAESVAVDDLDRLHDALGGLRSAGAAAGELLGRLESLGQDTDVDVARVRRLVELARRVERLRAERVEGEHGSGRARYGVVLTRGAAPDWAGRFPLNPFCVPLAVDLAADGPEVAAGLLRSMLEDRVEDARIVRRARLWLDHPADLDARESAIETLRFEDLTPDERATLPPILVLADAGALEPAARAGLSALLESGLPAKVLLLDGRDLAGSIGDATLAAVAQRRAYVASISIAHPAHLFDSMSAALAHCGPAFLHVHAPSPRRHGFPTDATIERAELAVRARVHPLLRYEPSRGGVFGSRIDLDGNPAAGDEWSVDESGLPWTPERWAAGEARFQDSNLPSDARGSAQLTVPGPNGGSLAPGGILCAAGQARREAWRTLQELAGVVTPFTEAVERRAAERLRQEREDEMAAVRSEYEARIAALERDRAADQADRLRKRLMQLAGYGAE